MNVLSNRTLLFFLAGLFLFIFIFQSCYKEEPLTLRGKITHSITGEVLTNMEIHIENIRCNGFQPALCDPFHEVMQPDEEGSFFENFFLECDSEVYVKSKEDGLENKRVIYEFSNVAGGDTTFSCNNRMVIYPGDNYYVEVLAIPQLFIDIYGFDDPKLELERLSFQGKPILINKNSSFQKRLKIPLSSFQGDILLEAKYVNCEATFIQIPYDYNQSDWITYDLIF